MKAAGSGERRIVTITDVAAAAGVSPSTVSRVLTGSHHVRAAREQRVLEAAGRLGYRPNAAARTLRRARSMTLGIVYLNLDTPQQLSILNGLGTAAQEQGYSLLVTNAQHSPELYKTLIHRLFEARVDGLFLATPLDLGDAVTPYLHAGVPVLALFTRDSSAEALPLVTADEAPAVRLAVSRLIELGHRVIGQVLNRVERDLSDRAAAIAAALADSGLREARHLTELIPDGGAEAARAATERLLRGPDRPTVIVSRDTYLDAVLAVLHEAGLRVPDDVSLVSFTDSPWAQRYTPPIATISVDSQAIGRLAAQVMTAWLRGTAPAPVTYASAASWIERESVGRAPALAPSARP